MAEIEKVSEADRMEQASLERVVSDLERDMRSSPPGTRPFFNGVILNLKARLGVLEKKIHDEEREKEQAKSNEVAVIQLAEKEASLDAKEKEEYRGFLKEDYFTKKDFSRLNEFYAHTWDRLSEGGKDQMSKRIWEGVRRNEYKFSDLPKDVQEKEEDRAYKFLKDAPAKRANTMQIPEADRVDFIRSYEKGDRSQAAHILDREGFKQDMFRNAESPAIDHASVTAGKAAEGSTVVAQIKSGGKAPSKEDIKAPAGSLGSVDVSALDLGAMKPPDVAAQSTAGQGKSGAARQS
jgi:hypothetical protein